LLVALSLSPNSLVWLRLIPVGASLSERFLVSLLHFSFRHAYPLAFILFDRLTHHTFLSLIFYVTLQLNRRSLLGRSLSQSKMHKLVKHIQADPVVKEVFDAKSEQLGPQLYRFKVEVEWDGSQMVQRFLSDLSEEEREVCS
jgi:hypothetical protein